LINISGLIKKRKNTSKIRYWPRWESAYDHRPAAKQHTALGYPSQSRSSSRCQRWPAQSGWSLPTLYIDGGRIFVLAMLDWWTWSCRFTYNTYPAIPPL